MSDLPRLYPSPVHMLAEAAARRPEGEAVVHGDERLTYREYLRCAAGLAWELGRLDAWGERVAVIMRNSIDTCIALFGVHAARAQVIPINPDYTERELGAILSDAAPRVVIYDVDLRDEVEPVVLELRIPHRIAVGAGARRLTEWRDDASLSLPSGFPEASEFASLQYTGGTTGVPKGVNLTHGAIATNVAQREAMMPMDEDSERLLCVLPLFHVYAISMGLHNMVHCRGTLVLMSEYRPEELLHLMESQRITVFTASPTLLVSLTGHEKAASCDFSALRLTTSGSAPLPQKVLEKWEAITGTPLIEGYGQSEAGPVISFNPWDGIRKITSVGVAIPETEIQIVDLDEGKTVLPPGERGEIRIRGPQVMSGYRNLPVETSKALREGWLHTGDIGELDEDDYLYIRGRCKEMIIVSGFNVFPREVEDVLFTLPGVREAAVIGISDEYRGELPYAFVVRSQGARTTREQMLEHCRANLTSYKVPTEIQLVIELPKTSVGKVDKEALGEIARASLRASR